MAKLCQASCTKKSQGSPKVMPNPIDATQAWFITRLMQGFAKLSNGRSSETEFWKRFADAWRLRQVMISITVSTENVQNIQVSGLLCNRARSSGTVQAAGRAHHDVLASVVAFFSNFTFNCSDLSCRSQSAAGFPEPCMGSRSALLALLYQNGSNRIQNRLATTRRAEKHRSRKLVPGHKEPSNRALERATTH